MAELRQYQRVRVAKLLDAAETYDGCKLNKRPPAVGDVGTLLDVLQAPAFPIDSSSSAAMPTVTAQVNGSVIFWPTNLKQWTVRIHRLIDPALKRHPGEPRGLRAVQLHVPPEHCEKHERQSRYGDALIHERVQPELGEDDVR